MLPLLQGLNQQGIPARMLHCSKLSKKRWKFGPLGLDIWKIKRGDISTAVRFCMTQFKNASFFPQKRDSSRTTNISLKQWDPPNIPQKSPKNSIKTPPKSLKHPSPKNGVPTVVPRPRSSRSGCPSWRRISSHGQIPRSCPNGADPNRWGDFGGKPKWVFPKMVVPPKHPKMVIFSRKTNSCWVPPRKGNPPNAGLTCP